MWGGGQLGGGGGSRNLLDKGLTRGGYEYSNPNNPTNKHGGMYKRMSGTRDYSVAVASKTPVRI